MICVVKWQGIVFHKGPLAEPLVDEGNHIAAKQMYCIS